MKICTRTWVGMLAALLMSLFYIHASQVVGRLGHDITYDDIAYVNDASDRLELLFLHGVTAFIHSFQTQPPHSPFSSVLAIVALLLGGYHNVVFYAANSLLLVAVVLFLIREFADIETGGVVWIVATFLCSPLAFNSIVHFRPDFAVGFASTAMIWWFSIGLFRGNATAFKLAGVAFGAALLIKPTFFPHTLAMGMGLIGLFGLVRFWSFGRTSALKPSPWSSILYFLGIAAVLASPYYIFGGRAIFEYFWTNTQGANAYLWSFSPETSLFVVIRTYLFGGYQHAIEFHLPLAILFITCGTAVFIATRNRAELAIMASLVGLAGASFLILVFGRHKNDFFFATFQSLVLLAGFHGFSGAYCASRTIAKWTLIGASWVALAVVIQLNQSHVPPPSTTEDSSNQSWNSRVISLVSSALEESRTGTASNLNPIKIFITVPGPVNAESAKWIATKQGIRVQPVSFYKSEVLSEYVDRAQQSDFVVIPNETYAEYYRTFPSTSVQPALAQVILNDPQFRQLGESDPRAHYFVFENTRLQKPRTPVIDVPPFDSVDGFATEEGPYPQWQLPRVQWMSQQVATICVMGPGEYSVQLRFRSDVPGALSIGSARTTSVVVGQFSPEKFVDYAFTHTFRKDDLCLKIEPSFSRAPLPDHVLLFSKLQMRNIEGRKQ